MPPTCMSLKRKAAYTVLVQNQNNARAFVQSEHFNRLAFPKLDKACEAFV